MSDPAGAQRSDAVGQPDHARAAAAVSPRRPHRRLGLLAAGIIALALLLALRWVSQPGTLAPLLLDRVGDSLGLEITVGGASEYRLRGTPMIQVRDLVVRQPGAATPVLVASRAALSLPWATIRARGADLTLTRIELDSPRVDLAALEAWQATRPPTQESRIPTLADGLGIEDGAVVGAGWSVEELDAQLPALRPRQPVRVRVHGRYVADSLEVPFDLQIAATSMAIGSGVAAVGIATVATTTWHMPMQVNLSGRSYSGDQGLGLDGLRFGARARYVAGTTRLPFVFGLGGRARYLEGGLDVAPLGLDLRGQDIVPSLAATGQFALGDAMSLRLEGELARWPVAWPALPPPLGQSESPLPFALGYRGDTDLSGLSALQLKLDATRFAGTFRLPAMLEWIDAAAAGTPLPPLQGTLSTPRVEVSGAVLEGVEIRFEDAAPSAPTPADPGSPTTAPATPGPVAPGGSR